MTALHVPAEGCCCIEDLAATAQAAIDQLVGYLTFVENGVISPNALHALAHTKRVAEALQELLSDYAENHGEPDAYHQALAASFIVRKVVG